MVALRDVAATSQCDVASKSPGEVAATSQGRPKVMSKSPWRCRCDIAQVTLLRRRYCDIAATSQGHLDGDFGKSRSDVAAIPLATQMVALRDVAATSQCDVASKSPGEVAATSQGRPKVMSKSPWRCRCDVAIAISLRYRLRVATAMSPQYCHGDVAAMSQ